MAFMALVSIAACAIFSMVTATIFLTGRRSELSRALALLVLPYAIWSFGNTFMFAADSAETAMFWDNMTSFGWTFFPTAMLHFTLVFTKHPIKLHPFLKKIIYFLPSLIFIPAQWYGQIAVADVHEWYGWTIRIVNSPLSTLFTILYITYISLSLLILWKHIRKSTGYRKKRTTIIFWSYTIAFICSAITENLFPALEWSKIPPLSAPFSLILVFGILFAIYRYNMLLSLNPSGIMLYSLNHNLTALKNILDSYPHFMFVIDNNKLIHHINRNAKTRFCDGRDLSEHQIDELFTLEQKVTLQTHCNLVTKTLKPQEKDYLLTEYNKDPFPATVTISPLTNFDNYHAGFVITIFDITTWKAAEQKLLDARDKAQEADRSKSEFLANISHELRTPMNAIIGFTNLMLETENNSETVEQLSLIDASGNYLLALVNDLLNIARIESGQCVIAPEKIEIFSYIKKINFFFPAKENILFSTTLSDNLPHSIIIDPLRLQQILINLISNAFKITVKGEIILALDYNDNNLLITVSGTRSGDSKKEQDNIDVEIGLSVVSKLVALLDGSIEVENEHEKNSFIITLPIKEEAPEPSFFS